MVNGPTERLGRTSQAVNHRNMVFRKRRGKLARSTTLKDSLSVFHFFRCTHPLVASASLADEFIPSALTMQRTGEPSSVLIFSGVFGLAGDRQ
nr:hypothetical protein Iba_chr05eCG9210 [Ipomoea batatas]